jgi:hypothetical protein
MLFFFQQSAYRASCHLAPAGSSMLPVVAALVGYCRSCCYGWQRRRVGVGVVNVITFAVPVDTGCRRLGCLRPLAVRRW